MACNADDAKEAIAVMTDHQTPIELRADLDLTSAPQECQRLLRALQAHREGRLLIEFDSPSPTQPSLQLFFAALKQAEAEGIPIDIGETAEAVRACRMATPDEEIAI